MNRRLCDKLVISIVLVMGQLAATPAQAEKSEPWHSLIDKGYEAECERNYAKADQWYHEALTQAEKQGSFSRMVRALTQLVGNRLDSHKWTEAEPFFKRLLAIIAQSRDSNKYDPEMAVWVEDMADAYYSRAELTDDPDIKEFCVEHYIESKMAIVERFDLQLYGRAGLLGTSFLMQGKYQKAEPFFQRQFEYLKSTRPEDIAARALNLEQLGSLALVSKQLTKAESLYAQSLQINGSLCGAKKLDEAGFERQLGSLNLMQGNLNGARRHYMGALEIDARSSGKRNFPYGLDCYGLGILAEKSNNYTEATKFFLAGVEAFEACNGPSSGNVEAGRVVMASEHLSKSLSRQGKTTAAKAYEDIANQLRTKHPEWAKAANPDPGCFFLVWGALPYSIDFAPSKKIPNVSHRS